MAEWTLDAFMRLLECPSEEQNRIEETAILLARLPELGSPIPGSDGLLYADLRVDRGIARIVYRST